MPEDLDESYHEYLWGEDSPRSFARKAKFVGTKNRRESRYVAMQTGTFDVSAYVSR